MHRIFLILLLLVGLTACAVSSGREMMPDELSRLVAGQTTKAEMLAMFGTPTTQGFDANGKTTAYWTYVHSKPPVWTWTPETRTQTLSALFDEKDVLERYILSDNPDAGLRYGK